MELSKQERLDIANTINKQLGGGKFARMTGAKNFLALTSGLQFEIPRTRNVRRVQVVLGPNDEYTMAFYSIRMSQGLPKVELLKSVYGIYAENLQKVFTMETGLDTHL